MLGEIFPRNGFCHLWALIVFEICSGEAITRNLRILNGCRFAAKYFDLYTMKIFRPSEPFSDSSSLSSTCMPTWGLKCYFRFCPGFISIHGPQFQEYSRQGTFFKHWRSHQDYCGLQLHHWGSSEASCSHKCPVMTIIAFCAHRHDCWQCRNLGCKLFRTAFQIWLIYLTRSPQQCSLELSIQMACIDYPMRSICMWCGIYYYYISHPSRWRAGWQPPSHTAQVVCPHMSWRPLLK